jgi:hypothetical protein
LARIEARYAVRGKKHPAMKQAAATTMAALVALTMWSAGAQAAVCSVDRGVRVLLRSRTLDPDVFVWDRKTPMIAYASGIWPGTKELLAHAVLTAPGTVAVTTACESGAIRPKNALAAGDAVAIRILSGAHRGRTGWVASDDVHAVRRPVGGITK